MKPSPASPRTHYDTLNVTHDAPAEVIRAAYRSLSQKHHPDRNPTSAEAAERMATLNAAYDVLSDSARRLDHDVWIRRERPAELPRAPEPRTANPPSHPVVKRSQPRRRSSKLRWGAAFLAFASVTFAGLSAVSPNLEARDSWLERAWHQSGRPELAAAPRVSDGLPRLDSALQEAARPQAPAVGLKWETALEGAVEITPAEKPAF